ncbi:MAG: CoA-binding protein [Gammaproteobacteria bacterium]|nr:CoA-binding protein [Gammaproteobacteria bacterium]MYC52456.1 CoA-binding protein [Gammaproteobacteria bacterium]
MRSVRTIAVIGMSRDPAKAARRVPSYLAAKGYDILPVNPFAARILGKPARKSLAEVTEPVDMVVVFRPSEEAGTHLAEAAARPERPVVWLQEDIRADEAAAEARARGIRVVQDMCTYRVHRAATADR